MANARSKLDPISSHCLLREMSEASIYFSQYQMHLQREDVEEKQTSGRTLLT